MSLGKGDFREVDWSKVSSTKGYDILNCAKSCVSEFNM